MAGPNSSGPGPSSLTANALKSATTTVNVSSATAPTVGQVLTATDSTHAGWATAAGGTTINATNNVLPKRSNATTFVDSRISDDGTIINIGDTAANTQSVVQGNKSGSSSQLSVGGSNFPFEIQSLGTIAVGDPNGDGNNLTIKVNDTAKTISIDSGAGVTTMGDVGAVSNGAVVIIDNSDVAGQAKLFAGSGPLLNVDGTINAISINRALVPSSAGLTTVGSNALPFSSAYIGNAATNNIQITGTATAARVATLQDLTQTLVGRAASVALTAQSASIGSTNIQVNGGVAPAGLYRLSYYLVTTTAGTSGTVSATFGWSDLAAARTSVSATDTFGSLAAPVTGTVIIQANGVANITYLTTVTAAVGSPVYALNVTLERLQ